MEKEPLCRIVTEIASYYNNNLLFTSMFLLYRQLWGVVNKCCIHVVLCHVVLFIVEKDFCRVYLHVQKDLMKVLLNSNISSYF